jgi:hypothetical protein
VVFTLVALVAGALTDSFYAALAAGVLVALPLTEFVWDCSTTVTSTPRA